MCKIFLNDEIVGNLKAATTGNNIGYCGQWYNKKAMYQVFIPELGICQVERFDTTENGIPIKAMKIVGIEVPADTIKNDLKKRWNGYRLGMLTSHDRAKTVTITLYDTIVGLYDSFTMQTNHNFGLDCRYIVKNTNISPSFQRSYNIPDFIQLCNDLLTEEQKRNNLGIISEKVAFNSRKAFIEPHRKVDAYYQPDNSKNEIENANFLNRKKTECKACLSTKVKIWLAEAGIGTTKNTICNSSSHCNNIISYNEFNECINLLD